MCLGKGPKIKKRESMVFDPKPNPYSDLLFLLNFLCEVPFTQFVKKMYIGVAEGSISPFKSHCTIGVRWATKRWCS